MKFRVLTVGDGDLSFSLALKRAYPQINVTASTLVESSSELSRTYANAVETSKEFQDDWKGQIIYGVDATKLAETIKVHDDEDKFDMILFNHPHLGDGTLLVSEQRHAERHFALLSHYFYSAKELLKREGRVHVCLCGNQPTSWKVMTAADNNGLECVDEESTAYPIDKWLFKEGETYELADIQPHYPTKRKFRNGSLGSKHFLARYGYRHQRTEGDLFDGSVKHINVEKSINFVFAFKESKEQSYTPSEETTCTICRLKFESKDQLLAHLDAPSLPDVVTGANMTKKGSGSTKIKQTHAKTACGSKQQIDSSPPPYKQIDFDDEKVLIEATVVSEFDSKRIKWLCRQDNFPLSRFIKSKSQCEEAIKKGRVFVNRAVALDSGRIVREGDTVSLTAIHKHSTCSKDTENEKSDIQVVREIQLQNKGITLHVAYKPVSIRCVGSFSPNTLEMKMKKRVDYIHGTKSMFCHPMSKLDTGCAGLCVLAVSATKIAEKDVSSVKVLYTFDVLVHGAPPEHWKASGIYAQVPLEGLRQWKRQKTNQQQSTGDNPPDALSSIVTSQSTLDLDGALYIQCSDSLQIDEQHISTLKVQSRFDSGRLANVISYVLRKLGYPVVNDRFGKREYLALPRRMKNIIKQKVCIGCFALVVTDYEGVSSTVSIDSHKRTQCSFWRETLHDAEQKSAS